MIFYVNGRCRNSHCSTGLTGRSAFRIDPRWGALEELELRDARLDLRHERDRACAGADHRDAFAFECVCMIPLLRMKRPAFEGFDARNIRYRGAREAAHPRNQHACRPLLSVAKRQLPAMTRVVVDRAHEFVAEAEVSLDIEAARAVFQIGADFGLAREHARPARIRRPGKRVDVRLHVARTARVMVIAPGAADRVRLLRDHEVGRTGLPEPDRHAETGKAGADDRDIRFGGRGRARGHRAGHSSDPSPFYPLLTVTLMDATIGAGRR
jgi:hypothetical protein